MIKAEKERNEADTAYAYAFAASAVPEFDITLRKARKALFLAAAAERDVLARAKAAGLRPYYTDGKFKRFAP